MKTRRVFKLATGLLLCVAITDLYLHLPTFRKYLEPYTAENKVSVTRGCSGYIFHEKCKNASVLNELTNETKAQQAWEITNNSIAKQTCPGTLFSERNTSNIDGAWYQADEEGKLYIVSAYYIKSKNKVFIIGAKPMYDITIFCRMWSKGNSSTSVESWETRANIGSPDDASGPLPYTATIFHCTVTSTMIPTHVSLVTKSCETARNILPVRVVPENISYQRRFTVCMAPVYSYDDVHHLVEWIELNKILGVEKFVVYNYSTAINIDHVINYYSKRGLAELIQWRPPFHILRHIHYFGQTVALNDCLFRNKQVSEYVSNIDKDEYIIPHSKNAVNWSQIILKLDKNADGYMFRNTFFRREWVNDDIKVRRKLEAEALNLLTMKHFERENKIFQNKDRSKFITRADKVDYVWIHTIPGAKVLTVSPTEGLLHHYRNWEKYKDNQKRVLDLTIPEKYGDLLINNVQDVWNDLAKYNVKLDLSKSSIK